jgi:hypothetical protein
MDYITTLEIIWFPSATPVNPVIPLKKIKKKSSRYGEDFSFQIAG